MITCNRKALSRLRKESRPSAASLQCFTSQGAGTQHPIHFSCALDRSHTITANSKASAIRQTQQQQTAKQALQSKQHSNRPQPAPPKPAHEAPARPINFLTPVPVIIPPPSRYVLAVPSASFLGLLPVGSHVRAVHHRHAPALAGITMKVPGQKGIPPHSSESIIEWNQ